MGAARASAAALRSAVLVGHSYFVYTGANPGPVMWLWTQSMGPHTIAHEAAHGLPNPDGSGSGCYRHDQMTPMGVTMKEAARICSGNCAKGTQMMMLVLAVLGLSAGAQSQPDTTAIYTVLLEQVRSENPGAPVVMAETRSGVACMPHCGASFTDEPANKVQKAETSHGSVLTRTLRERGLLDAMCPPVRNTFGCSGHPGHIFVALGDISESPLEGPPAVRGGYWVKVALLIPCARDCPSASDESGPMNAYGYWALVERQATGAWSVTKRLPAFAL